MATVPSDDSDGCYFQPSTYPCNDSSYGSTFGPDYDQPGTSTGCVSDVYQHGSSQRQYSYQNSKRSRYPSDHKRLSGHPAKDRQTHPQNGYIQRLPRDPDRRRRTADLRKELGNPRSLSRFGNRGTSVHAPPAVFNVNPLDRVRENVPIEVGVNPYRKTINVSPQPTVSDRFYDGDWTPQKDLCKELSNHNVRETFKAHRKNKRNKSFIRAIDLRPRTECRRLRDDKIRRDRARLGGFSN